MMPLTDALVLYKKEQQIGTLGIRLHYADNSIQHNGIKIDFGMDRLVDLTHHNLRYYYRYESGVVPVSGNTGAFLMTERRLF